MNDEMDMAADEAKQDLERMFREDPNLREAIKPLISWLKKWYMKAGYKRLNRILLGG